jgi:hypothetical protein
VGVDKYLVLSPQNFKQNNHRNFCIVKFCYTSGSIRKT